MSEHKGHLAQWVSGPLQRTEQIATEDGLLESFTLCLYWEPHDDGKIYWVDFELFEVSALGGSQQRPEYKVRDATRSSDTTPNLAEAEATAHGMVKWDGCTQFDMAQVHIDGKHQLDRLLSAVSEARRRCALAMRDNYDQRDEYPGEVSP